MMVPVSYRPPLLRQAVKWLEQNEIVAQLPRDFGPMLLRSTVHGDAMIGVLEKRRGPFQIHTALGSDQVTKWLNEALEDVNITYDALEITKEDFENESSEWAPLPIERENLKFQEVVEKLEKTIESVRSDNGYSANQPGERQYVLTLLKRASDNLQNDEVTTIPYLRTLALDPLLVIWRRFKGAALGVLAVATRDAIIEWLKGQGINTLNWILSHWS